eukprot:TRINITY_DN2806_c0_g1_i1.p1 TRINITY_DN2806_c0_g1~~TRINITY_DN2806_c0_g1_i1.p1  ORF type:complete len:263 (-),score=90.86 TRINITY_DN2806_c0_g1_i1:185-922(-)
MADKSLVWGVFTPECYDRLIGQQDFFHVQCIKLLISKMLGYAIIAGSSILKVFQILNVYRAGNGEGLAISSFILSAIGYTITLAYNILKGYPFSTFGEAFFILIQDMILVLMLLHYKKGLNGLFFVGVVAYGAGTAYLFNGQLSDVVLASLQTATIPIFSAARIPQIITNYQNKSTGVLSAVTCFLQFGGVAARLFTVLAEVNDTVVLAGILVSFVLNGIILLQIGLYWSNTNKLLAAKASKKDK